MWRPGMIFKYKKIQFLLIGFLSIWINLSFTPTLESDTKDLNTKEQSNSRFFGKELISDGPYIFFEDDKIVIKWIYRDRLRVKVIRKDNYNIIKRKFGFEFKPDWIDAVKNPEIDYKQQYNNVENLIAISDIHGQFDMMIELLQTHQVIDKHFNWIFGEGHVVILGDILDRGPKVTESLWFIFRLEQQAKKHGGKVHVLLGNHELMVLNNDARYIHDKYVKSASYMSTTYPKLFSDNSFLGKWLKQKPVMVTVNDMLFVHAGASAEFIKESYTIEQTNQLFNEKIIGGDWNSILHDSTLTFLMGTQGPLWYRGYFDIPIVREYQIDHILKYFKTNHIIVGHTSFPNIITLYNGKVIGIDSSIKLGNYGELLIYRNGKYLRGTSHGTLIDL